jgi:hypothetical protein
MKFLDTGAWGKEFAPGRNRLAGQLKPGGGGHLFCLIAWRSAGLQASCESRKKLLRYALVLVHCDGEVKNFGVGRDDPIGSLSKDGNDPN